MPLYLYHCNNCNKVFELLVFGQPKPVCPYCASKDAERKYDGIRIGGKTASGGTCTGNCSGCSGCGH